MSKTKDGRMRVTRISRMFAILFFAGIAIAQNAEPPVRPIAAEKIPAGPPQVFYADGELKIRALDATLADVLARVAALTGVKIDLPAEANTERLPMIELGPGPARQILASLLSESNFDYLIQAADGEPYKLQSVLLMKREKKASGTNGIEAAAHPDRSRGAVAARAEEAPVPETPVPAQPDNAVAAAQPVAVQPDQSQPVPAALSDQPVQTAPVQPEQWNIPKVAPQPLPQSLTPQAMNQQLQQMYQQRMQMQAAQTAAPANPGSK